MRRVAANYVFPVSSAPVKNGIIEFDTEGKIISVTDPGDHFTETSKLEFFNGILIPGFILPYCRIEPYIFQVEIQKYPDLEKFVTGELPEITFSADANNRFSSFDRSLRKSGIIGLGCITNRFHFFRNKSEGNLKYHSFIEILPEKKEDPFKSFSRAIEEMTTGWNDYELPSSVIPFNFCRDEEIMKYISDYSFVHDNPVILRCPGRNISAGAILEKFTSMIARHTGRTNSDALTSFRNPVMILAHDLDDSFSALNDNLFFIIPAGKLKCWRKFPGNLLFSSHIFSFNMNVPIMGELITTQLKFPGVSFDDLIRCYTLNPALALRMDQHAGSFNPGKKPGINLISNFDFNEMKLTEKSELKVIV